MNLKKTNLENNLQKWISKSEFQKVSFKKWISCSEYQKSEFQKVNFKK